MKRLIILLPLFFGLADVAVAAAAAPAKGSEAPKKEQPTWQDLVQKRDWPAAEKELRDRLVEAARKDQLRNSAETAELYYWHCVAHYFPALGERLLDAQLRDQLSAWLLAHRPFTEALLWSFSERDDPAKAFAVVADLVRTFGERVTLFPSLAIAYATVFDTSNYSAQDVAQGFNYYTSFGKRMLFDPQTLPVSLCKYLVDGRAAAEEKQQALNSYASQKNIAGLCDQVRLDEESYRDATQARLRDRAYTLANIRQHGGLHRDRVYFATEVGKAIGVPCTSVTVQSGAYNTLWVAYLTRSGTGTVSWRYGAGRYFSLDDDASGVARDPKEGRAAYADDLERDAAAMEMPLEQQRLFALQLGLATLLLRQEGAPRLPGEKAPGVAPEALPAAKVALGLAVAARNIDPLATEPWSLIAQASRRLDAAGTPLLEETFAALYGNRGLASHPFAAMRIFEILLGAAPEGNYQGKTLHIRRMSSLVRNQPLLTARLGLLEARALIVAGRKAEAFNGLTESALNHAKVGFVVLDLLEEAEKIARDDNQLDAIIRSYESVLARLSRPERGPWAKESVYYHILDRLAKLYRDRGSPLKVDFYTRQMKGLSKD